MRYSRRQKPKKAVVNGKQAKTAKTHNVKQTVRKASTAHEMCPRRVKKFLLEVASSQDAASFLKQRMNQKVLLLGPVRAFKIVLDV